MEKLQEHVRLRPIDLAREHGLSTQAVRNYEADGVLPAADRTPSGYRTYTPAHVLALRAFLALVPGHGHPTATAIMQAVNRSAISDALRLIDESHAQLLTDRRTLTAVESALRALDRSAVPPRRGSVLETHSRSSAGTSLSRASAAVPPSRGPGTAAPPPGDMFVGPLARRLGIRPATLRQWERAGVVEPRRDPRTGYRVYSETDVRDAQLAHQLRRGGFALHHIAPVIARIRSAGGVAPLESMLHDWHDRLHARGRAMLTGAAALSAYLEHRPPSAR